MGTWWECGDFNQIGDMGMLMGDMDGYGGISSQARQKDEEHKPDE